MRKHSILVAACTAMSIAGMLSGSAVVMAQSKVTNITIWATELSSTDATRVANAFNATHPNIHVTTQYISKPDDFMPKLSAAISTNTEPTVVLGGDPSWGPGLLQTGKLLDLTGKVDSIDSKIYPGVLSAEFYKGKQVGIPYGTGDYALFYNKKDFAAAHLSPPKTWGDVVQDSIKLTDASKNHYGFYVPWGSDEWTVWTFEGLLWANGGDLLSKNEKKATFNSAAGVKALKTWVDLVQKYHAAPTTSFATPGTDEGSSAFASGAVSMILGGPWDLGVYKTANIDYGVVLFPKGDVSSATNVGIGNIWLFNTSSDQVKAALTFAKWFMNPAQLAQVQVTEGDLPVSDGVLSEPDYKKWLNSTKYLNVFAKNLHYAHARPTLVSYNAISAALGKEIDLALHGQISPTAALDAAAKQADQILAQNKE